MPKFYSKTTGGFYDTEIYRLSTDKDSTEADMPTMPVDVVPVTDSAYADLFAAQSTGQLIQADANGNTEAVNPPAPSSAQVHVALQASAQAALDKSDITVVRCVAAQPPVPVPSDLAAYRADLRAIVNGLDATSTTLPTEPPEPIGI